MQRPYILVSLVLIWCSCSPQTSTTDENTGEHAARPNVILIMADDMGYSDLGCYGNSTIRTPHIDSLAAGGMKLTDYHSNGAVCSPTRASLMTGLYPQEVGIQGVVTAKSHRHVGMDPARYTIAELFKDAGYRTALFGKWHLGYRPEFGPSVQGFDEFRGFVSGNVDYQSHIDQEGHEDWWDGSVLKPEEGYLTDIITNHGVRFVERAKGEPFFLYLAHGAPHYPYQAPGDPAQRSVDGNIPTQASIENIPAVHQEMIESLDSNVGKIIACLKQNNLLQNTLVIFCSDNGASPKVGSNAPFRGNKGQLYEGGHRVPAIFYWKRTIQPGVSDGLVLSMDMFPTIADLTNVEMNNSGRLSGQNIAPLIKGNRSTDAEERIVFWRTKNQKAARKGKWKLVIDNGEGALFDLETDLAETRNVKVQYPKVYGELEEALKHWESGLKVEIKA